MYNATTPGEWNQDNDLDTITDKIESALWHSGTDNFPLAGRLIVYILRLLYAVLRDALTTTLTLRAMGLVYVTILSIVPLIAIMFSVLKGFGFHKQLEPFLYTFLSPLGDKGRELTSQMMGFVDNIQGGVLAGIGLLLLFYTTVSMIKKVEESLNYVWRVELPRNFLQRLSEYLSILLIGPVLMVTAMGLIAAASSNSLITRITDIEPFGTTLLAFGKIMPHLLVSVGFILVYWLVPNTNVRFHAAVAGGLFGGFLWAASGFLFATFVVTATHNIDIYASFAIVIIALMWLYLSWLILLIGAQVAFYIQHPDFLRIGHRNLNIGNQLREQLALAMMLKVAEAFRAGQAGPTMEGVAAALNVPGIVMGPVERRLLNARLLQATGGGRLVPAKEPAQIRLTEIIDAVRSMQETDIFPEGHWPESVADASSQIQGAIRTALGNRNLYDLLGSESRPL